MHLLRSLSMKGFTSSMVADCGMRWNSTNPTSISEAILRRSHSLPLSHTRQVSGWLARMSLSIVFRRSITFGDSVFITIPGSIGVTQDAANRPERSSSTWQILQAPIGVRWGSWHRVGIYTPDSRANSSTVIPRWPLTSLPLSVMVIASNVSPPYQPTITCRESVIISVVKYLNVE